MPFDPSDVEALKRRRHDHAGGSEAMVTKEHAEGFERREPKRAGLAKTVQFNVRISVEDRAFLTELSGQRKLPVVDIVADAIDLLRRLHVRA